MAGTEDFLLTGTRIRDGVWEGQIRRRDGAETPAPVLEARHLGEELFGLRLEPHRSKSGVWAVQLPISPKVLSEGVQTVIILDKETGERLSSFSLVAGEPLEEDLRAEIELLRAELDLLKRAFRRHCAED